MEQSIKELQKLYKQYLGDEKLEDYLKRRKDNKKAKGDEERITDPLLEKILKNKKLFGYTENKSILQQQTHKVKGKILKPDFETNNEICKKPFLFDAKSSNIPLENLTKGEVFKNTFKRYLTDIKPPYSYILGFNLEYFILYSKETKEILTKIVDVKKLFSNDTHEVNKFKTFFLDKLGFEKIDYEDKVNFLVKKELEEEALFDIDRFINKFEFTKNKLFNFFYERITDIGIDNIDDNIKNELLEFLEDDKIPKKERENNFYIQLANRLTLLEFFKYIFIRTYEDFKLIHKTGNNTPPIPVTFGKEIKKLKDKYGEITNKNIDNFVEDYFKHIQKVSFKDIGSQFFEGFASLFQRYETFIKYQILEGDSEAEEFDHEYYSNLFDILYFLNEFNFAGLEEDGQDIIGRLFEKSLERKDRKKFGQFYTPRYIIEFILDELNIEPSENKKILDPACGTGGFLMKYLSKVKGDLLKNEDILENVFKGTYGIDIKMFSTLLTKLNLALSFIIKNKKLISRGLPPKKLKTDNIITGDGLELDKKIKGKGELEKNFDYVIGNPPYVGIKGNSDIVSQIKDIPPYKDIFHSKPDLYYFFILQGVDKLKEGGQFGYIIPREWMTADFAKGLRNFLLNNTKIQRIIDFSDISIFEDAGTTSSILLLEKGKAEENHNFEYIKFIKKDGLNIIEYIDKYSEQLQTKDKQKVLSGRETFEQKIIKKDFFYKIINFKKRKDNYDISRLSGFTSGLMYLTDFIEIKEVKYSDLSERPWIFNEGLKENDKLIKLGDILKVSQGIVSGADKVSKRHIQKGLVPSNYEGRGIFVLKEGKEIRGNGLKDIKQAKENIGDIEINLYENGGWTKLNENEKELIKPMIGGKHLNKWSLKNNEEWIIYNSEKQLNEKLTNIKKYLDLVKNIIKSSSSNAPYGLHRARKSIPFEEAKIIFNTKTIDFTYFDKTAYGNGGGLGGLNFIFIDTKNPYTKEIEKYSSKEDYLKFINAVLNSKIILDYIKQSNFNSLSVDKIRGFLIPKINFEDKKQVEKYNKIVELSDKLIEIYNNSNKQKDELLKKLEENGLSYEDFINCKDFILEEDEDIGNSIIIKGKLLFDDEIFKKLKNCEQGKTIGECLGLIGDSLENNKEIKKIEEQINKLISWFYEGGEEIEEDIQKENKGSDLF